MIPVLFTQGSLGPNIIFGFYTRAGLHPVRSFPLNKVRRLGTPKAEVPKQLVILKAGDECMTFLADIGLLSPILESMAAELAASFAKAKPPRKGSKFKAAFDAEVAALAKVPVIDSWGNTHG